MKQQGLVYCAAMKAAMADLDRICQESERLKNRLHLLDAAAEALKPFIGRREQRVEVSQPAVETIATGIELSHVDEPIIQMVGSALPEIVPMNLIEPTDPIQRRINSVLGLAVA